MKKILVTGATGFIGNYVVKELLNRGYEVIATSRDKEKALAASWYKKLTYIQFDLSQFESTVNYYSFFNKPDAMIHLAWEGLPNYKESFHVEKNLPVHFAFLENLVQNGLTNLTISGTCFEYGMKEGCLNENMECEPANPYALAKNELRKKLETLQLHLPFILKWVRLFYMYGEGQSPKSLISQLDMAISKGENEFNMSGGEQVRDFLPVHLVAAYLADIAMQDKGTGIINCCSGRPVTVKQFVLDYLQSVNKTISLNLGYYPYVDYEPMSFWGDNSKLVRINKHD